MVFLTAKRETLVFPGTVTVDGRGRARGVGDLDNLYPYQTSLAGSDSKTQVE